MLRNMLFLAYLAAGLGAAFLRFSGQIDDRISARIFGILTMAVCLTILLLRRGSRQPGR